MDNKINSFYAKDKKIAIVLNIVDDGDAVNKRHLNEILNINIYQEVLSPLDPDSIRIFEMDLNLYHTFDPRVFILKGTVKNQTKYSNNVNFDWKCAFKRKIDSSDVIICMAY